MLGRSYRRGRGRQDFRDRLRERRPRGRLGAELLPSLRGDAVILRAAVVLRDAPLTLDPTPSLEPVQSRVERALLDLQYVVGRLLQPPRDGITVHRTPAQRFEDEDIQSSLKQVDGLWHR